ncbi:uncharacterized protein LOC135107477 [Scylla paramamosain]|uniref:uncharacterized protein LOC135107477 n=1 Tax=Scylla paramamosain TaxID=85552 RepID=UPI0030828A62
MAGITSRFMARTLTSIHTTPVLRSSTKTISSFKRLLNFVQQERIQAEEMEDIDFVRHHLEVLSFWHDEAEKMSQTKLSPSSPEQNVQGVLREQIVELMEQLMDEGAVDARTG